MSETGETQARDGQLSNERTIDTRLVSSLMETLQSAQPHANHPTDVNAAGALVADAVRQRATDIHLDPERRGVRVRMRIDGVVRDAALLVPAQGDRLINQFKTLAGIDPVTHFDAEESRFSVSDDQREIDLRLAVIPALHGDKLTIRVLDPHQLVFEMEEIGLNAESIAVIQQWSESRGGMFIVAGPVGSGKTTTVYSLLHRLRLRACSVCTLEDPIEYNLDGINQVQVDKEHGLTFASGVKALARHDPDVVLVGELRDAKAARAAYGAAALGRTILTTVHARDAVGAITALRYFGLDLRDIAATVSMVVSQRLVRKLCTNCRWQSEPTNEEKCWLQRLDLPIPESSWQPGGCERCGQSGYYGQTGVFETWCLDEEDYHLLCKNPTEREIRDHRISREHGHFLADAVAKARSGVTTLAELRAFHLAGPTMSSGAAAVQALDT